MSELRYLAYTAADRVGTATGAIGDFWRSRLVRVGIVSLIGAFVLGSVTGLGGNIAAAAVAAVLLLALVYLYPPVAAWSCVGIAPFIIGFARGQFLPEMRLNEPMFMVLLAGLGLHALVYRGSIGFKWNRFDVATVAVMAFGSFIPLAVHYGRLRGIGGGDVLYALAPIKFTVAYFICRISIRTERELDLTLKISLITASIVSVVAMADSMNIGGFAYMLSNYVPSGEVIIDDGRGGSTFGNPIGMGVYATINALVALCYFSLKRGGAVLMRIAFACCVGGIIGSGQVTGLIALAVGTVAFIYINGGLVELTKRLLPMFLVAVVVLWPLIAQRIDQFGGYEVSSQQRDGVEFAEPRDQPFAIWELNPGSSWDYRLFNLETYFFPEFEDRTNIIWGVQNEARVAAPEFWRDWVWIEAGYLWLIWIGGIPYVLAFLAFIGVGLYEFRKVARRRRGTGEPPGLTEKITGVAFSGLAILFVVQGFDPHLTLRGTADILFPLLGCVGFLLQPLSFWKGTSLDKALYEQPGPTEPAAIEAAPIEPAQSTVGMS